VEGGERKEEEEGVEGEEEDMVEEKNVNKYA
jgi:hypothetical protein